MKRHMILAVAAVLAVAAAGPALADPGSGGRNRGSETQNHDRDRNGGWDNDDGYGRDGGRRDDWPGTPRIDRWEERLGMKIRQGLRSGALTRQEGSTLRNKLAQIHRQENQFKRDGRVTARERQILANSIERLTFRIDRELADRQGRSSRYGRRG